MPRSSLNLTNNGSIENYRKQSNKTLRHRKSSVTITRKISPGRKNQDRLAGGADNSVTEEVFETTDATDVAVAPPQVTLNADDGEEVFNNKPEAESIIPSGGPCCFCVSKIPTTTGNKKLDEMFDYVQQNLQEAGKALATLSDNFEHDFKVELRTQLLLIDMLGRMQQWTGLTQSKLDACKTECDLLRKELMSRLCEINNKQAELLTKEQDNMKKEQEIATLKDLLRERSRGSNRYSELDDTGSQTFEGGEEGEHSMSKTKLDETMHGPSITTEGYYEEHGSRSVQEGAPITTRKEAELEAELLRLRQENERIMKERSDYENAIQRALLRGVSCLNVETLKVLRAPSIYCAPCAPSTAPTENQTPSDCCKEVIYSNDRHLIKAGCLSHRDFTYREPVVPCKTAKASSAGRKSKVCKRGDYEKSAIEEQLEGDRKPPCGTPCCTARKSRKCTSNSLLFLLHQADPVTACVKNHENRMSASVCQGPRRSDAMSAPVCRK